MFIFCQVPDDHIAAIANSFTIRQMNLKDKDNFLASSNIHSAAIKMGWWNPDEEPFDFFKSYGYMVQYLKECYRRNMM